MLSPFTVTARATAAVIAILLAASSVGTANDAGTTEAGDGGGATEASPAIAFDGEVSRGDTLVHRFKHGDASFEFRLASFSGGWTISIGDPMHPGRNFVAVATPPFRGVNAAVIDGWHFRNADNTGPNEPGEKNVNAPGFERDFAFVVDMAGYTLAVAARDIALTSGGEDTATADQPGAAVFPVGKGKLVVQALELGNLAPNQRAVVERMAFAVRLEFPE